LSDTHSNDSLLDMYLFETSQNIELLEEIILISEKEDGYSDEAINEIFRHMHTIKGSSAMMLFHNIATLAHSIEDLFFFLREQQPQNIDSSTMTDLILDGVDFIKVELEKIRNGDKADGDAESLINKNRDFLELLKQTNDNLSAKLPPQEKHPDSISRDDSPTHNGKNAFKAIITFTEDCEMENLRALSVVNNLKDFAEDFHYIPNDIVENDHSAQRIRSNGFVIYVKTDCSYDELHQFFMNTIFLKELELFQITDEEFFKYEELVTSINEPIPVKVEVQEKHEKQELHTTTTQSIISVNVTKLDKLMDLVGEMVIAEAMVIQNPDLKAMINIENFHKAARQLHKITTELQDTVMSIRMVPLSNTFHKMHRIVRDMSKKLDRQVKLELIGEETEVDKNIIEHISDPLMHLVRNAIDHGIESASERMANGKQTIGTITLEAKSAGNDVLIYIKDDGKGLNKEKLLAKGREQGLITKTENELTDKEIYNLIFIPGFSTKENISEFSGRGVGMDVVIKNIEAVGGSASVESVEGSGTTVILKIPLTLAIIDGMNVKVGNSCYTIPTTAIKESFRPRKKDYIKDPDANEMIMVRGDCYPILRLNECFHVKTTITDFTEGILIMVEQDEKVLCIFADELLGQQQVVVKALPNYIKNTRKIQGLSGCTLLGDGSISLILDIGGLISMNEQKADSMRG
jgi:two-component system chemotaxis sensor kinase CheA